MGRFPIILCIFCQLCAGRVTDKTMSLVVGQADFTSSLPNRGGAVSASGFNGTRGIAVDIYGNLFVADQFNNRVLKFLAANMEDAAAVYGQIDFTVTNASVSGVGMQEPVGIALNGPDGNLWVAESGGDRLALWNTNTRSLISGSLFGQNSVTQESCNRGPGAPAGRNTLCNPKGIALDSVRGQVYVADAENTRILGVAPFVPDASYLFGQPDFDSNMLLSASNRSVNIPYGLCVDVRDNLYVVDTDNNRILFVPKGSSEATGVFGQATFTGANAGTNQAAFRGPESCAFDLEGNLYVCDEGNNRVLVLSPPSSVAIDVFGQASFVTSDSSTSDQGLSSPSSVFVDVAGNLWVSDRGNNRVVRFGSKPLTTLASNATFSGSQVVNGSLVSLPSAAVIVAGSLEVLGNFKVDGGTLTVLGNLTVSGGLQIGSSANLTVGSSGSIQVGVLTILDGSTLFPQVASIPPGASSVVVTIAQYSAVAGAFSSAVAPVVTGVCALGSPVLNYGSSSLTATMSVQDNCGGAATTPGGVGNVQGGGLTTGEIVGIAIGAAIGGIVVVVIIVLLSRCFKRRATMDMSARLKGEQLNQFAQTRE